MLFSLIPVLELIQNVFWSKSHGTADFEETQITGLHPDFDCSRGDAKIPGGVAFVPQLSIPFAALHIHFAFLFHTLARFTCADLAVDGVP